MTASQETHTGTWKNFTIVSFALSAAMLGAGILFMPLDLWMKGYLAMGALMLTQSCITMTKTQRDIHEATKLMNRIEDARTERFLMEAGKTS